MSAIDRLKNFKELDGKNHAVNIIDWVRVISDCLIEEDDRQSPVCSIDEKDTSDDYVSLEVEEHIKYHKETKERLFDLYMNNELYTREQLDEASESARKEGYKKGSRS